jgi:hypothetical protein
MGIFILLATIYGYMVFQDKNFRWIDLYSRLGLIINGIAILHAFHFNNQSKIVSY